MANNDDIKFQELGKPERKILLTALEFSIDNLECFYCEKKVDYINCCIMPTLRKSKELAIILCNSPLCMSKYLGEMEKYGFKIEKSNI